MFLVNLLAREGYFIAPQLRVLTAIRFKNTESKNKESIDAMEKAKHTGDVVKAATKKIALDKKKMIQAKKKAEQSVWEVAAEMPYIPKERKNVAHLINDADKKVKKKLQISKKNK